MGNQLAVAPSQIFPVEHYLTDLQDLTFETRYCKCMQCNTSSTN